MRSQSTRMQKSTDVDRKLTDRGHKGCYSETSNLTQQRLLSLKNCRVNTGLIPQNSHWLGSGKGGSMWSSGWLGIDCAHLLAWDVPVLLTWASFLRSFHQSGQLSTPSLPLLEEHKARLAALLRSTGSLPKVQQYWGQKQYCFLLIVWKSHLHLKAFLVRGQWAWLHSHWTLQIKSAKHSGKRCVITE